MQLLANQTKVEADENMEAAVAMAAAAKGAKKEEMEAQKARPLRRLAPRSAPATCRPHLAMASASTATLLPRNRRSPSPDRRRARRSAPPR